MSVRQESVGGKEVRIRPGSADACLITFYADFDSATIDQLLESVPGITAAAVKIEDWNTELSPWKADPVFGDEGFGEGAQDTLGYITDALIPETGCDSFLIGGYSLAGLFSLWSSYRTDVFSGCAAASPSVWFPGWDVFIEDNPIRASRVYLSLGDKESRTRNPVMRTVGERIQMQYDVLKGQLGEGNVKLEWNPGNHFADATGRTAKAFRWLIG